MVVHVKLVLGPRGEGRGGGGDGGGSHKVIPQRATPHTSLAQGLMAGESATASSWM